jgi:hypothetical protein
MIVGNNDMYYERIYLMSKRIVKENSKWQFQLKRACCDYKLNVI